MKLSTQHDDDYKRKKQSPTMHVAVNSNIERMLQELTSKMDGHAAETSKNFARLSAEQQAHVKQLEQQVNSIGSAVDTMQGEVEVVKADVAELSSTTTSLRAEQKGHGVLLANLQQQVHALTSKVAKHDVDIADCREAGVAMQEDKNREHRNQEIMVRGVPLSGAEKLVDLEAIMIKLAKAINLTIAATDIEEAHVIKGRTNRPDSQHMMVVRFASI